MSARKLLALCALCVLFCFSFGLVSDVAFAQNDSKSTKNIDKDLATKKGVANSLASGKKKEEGEDDLNPNKAQMALGVGSFIVMIIVVKWL